MNPHGSESTAPDPDRVIPREGWHVIHLFYHLEQAQWALCTDEEKLEAKTNLAELVQEIRSPTRRRAEREGGLAVASASLGAMPPA